MAKEENLPVFMDVSIDGSYHGRMVFELFYDIVPFTAENFRALCAGEKRVSPKTNEPLSYALSFFHKVKKGSSYVKGGAFCYETGEGGESIYGSHFQVHESNSLKHDTEGLLTMSKVQLASSSHFLITSRADHTLDSSHVIFGKLVQGIGTVGAIAEYCSQVPIRIEGCGLVYNVSDIPPGVIVWACWPPQSEVKEKKRKEGRKERRKSGK